ncbi:hypothetical protein BS50DRAFT_292237 [Corynespora cassiicola Philippines]|uniref:Uncharacterized protein n=1 Tax=Corynespora cassiicola Philippines TaxID=1448308 RepID=A0A2T2NX13_CORCC|nr:hypothetical protein BS50DRAFT_292237 [Corynespora cassiicola Philippines]
MVPEAEAPARTTTPARATESFWLWLLASGSGACSWSSRPRMRSRRAVQAIHSSLAVPFRIRQVLRTGIPASWATTLARTWLVGEA